MINKYRGSETAEQVCGSVKNELIILLLLSGGMVISLIASLACLMLRSIQVVHRGNLVHSRKQTHLGFKLIAFLNIKGENRLVGGQKD